MKMVVRSLLLLALALGAGEALGQPAPSPDPFRQSGASIYPVDPTTCLTFPLSVAGGCPQPGALNVLALYLQGGLVVPGSTTIRVVTSGSSFPAPVGNSVTIIVNKTAPSAISVVLPAAALFTNCPSVGCPTYRIKDGAGVATVYPITISAQDGAPIDGASNFIINNDFQGVTAVFDGTHWNLF